MFLIDIFYFLILLLTIIFMPKYLFKKEYRKLLTQRLNPENLPVSDKKRIWIHAVSVGEVKSIKKLITDLINIKNTEIILSVTTPTGYKVANNEYNSIKVIMAPIDFSFTIKKFIKNIKPDVLILNELELWPNWISEFNKKKIPILLINGRVSITAMAKYKRSRFLLKFFFNKINLFLVQEEIYKKRFIELGVKPDKIKICGNIKADEAISTLKNVISQKEILNYLKIEQKNSIIITCASTHISDEKVIFPVISKSYKEHSFIIVPRHPARTSDISRELDQLGIKYEIWSKSKGVDLKNKVLIFDMIGYLFNIQSISNIVIMGGTFDKKIGGHNLFEPAVLGKNIIGGPFYNNFPDIGEELVKSGIYKEVKNSDKMIDEINSISLNNVSIKEEAIEIVSRRRGSIEYIIKEIQKLLN